MFLNIYINQTMSGRNSSHTNREARKYNVTQHQREMLSFLFSDNINIIQIKFQAHVSLCLHSRLVYMEGFCTDWRRIH